MLKHLPEILLILSNSALRPPASLPMWAVSHKSLAPLVDLGAYTQTNFLSDSIDVLISHACACQLGHAPLAAYRPASKLYIATIPRAIFDTPKPRPALTRISNLPVVGPKLFATGLLPFPEEWLYNQPFERHTFPLLEGILLSFLGVPNGPG